MNIGVFFGSRSTEHDVSIITGEFIAFELKKLGHTVVPVYIGKDGQWYVDEELGSLKFFKTSGNLNFKDYDKVYLDLEKSKGKLVFKKKGLSTKEFIVDMAFPAFHGVFGEDGTIQGLFEFFGVPYVGCDVPSSAITMDKILTKLFCQRFNIPTVDFVYFDASDWAGQKAALIEKCKKELSWPMFVKPPKLGSSIGIAKVTTDTELEAAAEVALRYGNRVLVEKAVQNLKDLTCAVLGNDKPQASLIQESAFDDELFSYEDKYLTDGGAQFGNAKSSLIIPANIPDETTKAIREMSVDIFKLFGLSGTSRIDFLYDQKANQFYVTEINTLPGTLYHHLWKATGIEMGQLLTNLLDLAAEKHAESAKFIQTFQSSILQFANSIKLNMSKKE